MRFLYALLLTTFTFCTFSSSAQWTQKDFKKLRHIAGNWESTTPTGFMQEKWAKKSDTLFTGTTYSINRGVSILEEHLQLVFTSKEIQYIVTIRHQNKGLPVIFKLVSVKDDAYTFENKEHDFPQQIVYYFKNNKHIDVTISGNTEQGKKTMEFHFEKKLRL
jgi:hypothetical protein